MAKEKKVKEGDTNNTPMEEKEKVVLALTFIGKGNNITLQMSNDPKITMQDLTSIMNGFYEKVHIMAKEYAEKHLQKDEQGNYDYRRILLSDIVK